MKLLSLNIWCGKEYNALIEYLANHKDSTDVFCFQEVLDTSTDNPTTPRGFKANLFQELSNLLPNHVGYFSPEQDGCDAAGKVDFPITFGKAMFVRKSIKVVENGEVFVYRDRNGRIDDDNDTFPASLQYSVIENEGETYTIAHLHGLWTHLGKGDNDDRIKQSEKVNEFLSKSKGKIILTGDFNLLPDSKSIALLEDGLVNLIKEHRITSTRSALYTRAEKFADYTFVSSDVKVISFAVPYTEASDHLPMVLEFF